MTPAGLLEGAKSIVSCNKQLRKELQELEMQVESVQKQNQYMVSERGTKFTCICISF